MRNHLYITKDRKRWESLASRDYRLPDCKCQTISNGYILPLRRIAIASSESDVTYEGGVQSENGKFVAGHRRYMFDTGNMSMCKTYTVGKDVIFDKRRVIFGGLLIDLFGHCLTEVLSRLWYLFEIKDNIPIVFCVRNLNSIVPEYFYDIMELLGVERDRIIIAKEVVQYREIVVPDQALILFVGSHDKICSVYDHMLNAALKKHEKDDLNNNFKRVYLSRNLLSKADCFNENWFEKFYTDRGYKVVYPETLPLYEQIAIISQAEEVVCTGGTLSHLLLFATAGCKATILIRHNEAGALTPQFIINQMKQIDVNWVDISYSFLPTTHACGVFLVGPTQDFVDYLNAERIHYFDDEIVMDFEGTVWKYIQAWIENYSRNWYAYKRINKLDIFDVVNNMSTVINQKPLTRKQMATPDKNIRMKQLEEIENKFKVADYSRRRKKILMKEFIDALVDVPDEQISRFQNEQKRPFVVWTMHVAYKGWLEPIVEGEAFDLKDYSGQRMEALIIELMNADELGIKYSVCKKKGGWTQDVSAGEIAGSVGESNAITAVKVYLVDKKAFEIMYRVGYADKWSGWYKGGERTDENQFPYLERIQLKLIAR